jgi:hypothetical protein
VISWQEDRSRALEDALQFLAASIDAGSEAAVKSIAGGNWSDPDRDATARAAGIFSESPIPLENPGWRQRVTRMADWLGDRSAVVTPPRPSLNLASLGALPARILSSGDEPSNVVQVEPLVRAMREISDSGSTLPAKELDALTAAAAWLVDCFEVEHRLEPAYPRRRDGQRLWAAATTYCEIAQVWFVMSERLNDPWFLNSALHIVDELRSFQHASVNAGPVYGALPSRLADGSNAEGNARATIEFVAALLAEQLAISHHSLFVWNETPLAK